MEDKRKLKSRIDWFCENRVNAFSPTISPAPKNKLHNELESIESAIQYYVSRGVHDFIIQPKYMGSYCDIYLHKDIEETYFVSRNGYVIQHIALEEARESLKELHRRFDWTHLKLVIIQSELLPWYALGGGLIENEFKAYLQAHQTHYDYLNTSGLYHRLAQVKQSATYQAFHQDKEQLTAAAFKAKYPSHVIRQYQAMAQFSVWDLPQYEKGLRIYEEQINHFGEQKTIHFKPFNLLKRVWDDGREEIPNSNLTYKELNDDDCITISIHTDSDLRDQLREVYQWFETLSEHKEEGIMIKPQTSFLKGLPPAFKVRNAKYLTMIYGIDFIDQYEHHMQKRNIARKLECSINDWMINWELLKTPYHQIDKENYYFKNLVLDRILGEQIENNLDHRL